YVNENPINATDHSGLLGEREFEELWYYASVAVERYAPFIEGWLSPGPSTGRAAYGSLASYTYHHLQDTGRYLGSVYSFYGNAYNRAVSSTYNAVRRGFS